MQKPALIYAILIAGLLSGCTQPAANTGRPMVTTVQRSSWNSDYSSGVKLLSPHYVIYTTSQSHSLLTYLPGFMEAAHENYLKLTGLSDRPPEKSMPIYMMGSRSEWAALTGSITGANSGVYLSIEAGGYCYKGVCVFWDTGGISSLSIASHESLHQFFHYRLRHHLPVWLEEGLCASAEGYYIDEDTVTFTPDRNLARFSNLRNAIIQGYWIPFGKLLSMDPGDIVTKTTERAVGYYGQLWALSVFIRSDPLYGKGMKRMLVDAEAGRFHEALGLPAKAVEELQLRGRIYNRTLAERLFRRYISNDLETFEQEYRAFAYKLAKLQAPAIRKDPYTW